MTLLRKLRCGGGGITRPLTILGTTVFHVVVECGVPLW